MANNIYVGGFPYKTTKEELAKLFSACGRVLSAKVILDRETGRPKGFGFVEMSTDAEAAAAVEKLNGSFIGDRKIFAVVGRPQKDRPQARAPKPGFVERRSGKDRRAQAGAAPAPAPIIKKWGKKPWEKKPFDAAKKPFERKPPVRGPKWIPKKG